MCGPFLGDVDSPKMDDFNSQQQFKMITQNSIENVILCELVTAGAAKKWLYLPKGLPSIKLEIQIQSVPF